MTREPLGAGCGVSVSIHGLAVVGSRSVSTRAGLSHLIEADQGLPPMGLPLHPPQGEERECVEVVAVALGLTDVCAS